MTAQGPVVIAIDGPAASGKSTTAAAVAARTGLVHIDSGSWYRALTWLAATRSAITPAEVLRAAGAVRLRGTTVDGAMLLEADGVRLDAELRRPDVTGRVSAVAAWPDVRDWVNARLHEVVQSLPGAVIDGRDIGTVVFPAAPLKVFLTASPLARARRRLEQRGGTVNPEELDREAARLGERDRLDAARPVAPLRAADDAVVIDTTDLAFGEQVERILALVHERGLLDR